MAPTEPGIGSRLFLSADLVGSTARKQAMAADVWIGEILAFYLKFAAKVRLGTTAAEERLRQSAPKFTLTDPPTLWKAVGDELIYSAPVRHEHDIRILVDGWIDAMRQTERDLLDKTGMDLKGGAWLATFPDPDRVVAVPIVDHIYDSDRRPEVVNRELLEADLPADQVRRDYIGPGIDTGFRVLADATPRRFAISVEVAWAIAASVEHSKPANGDRSLGLYFAGERTMKGVWAGQGYPIFWLDTGNHHGAQTKLDNLAGLRSQTPASVRELARALHETNSWPCRIYLEDSTYGEFQRDKRALDAAAERIRAIDDTSGDDYDTALATDDNP